MHHLFRTCVDETQLCMGKPLCGNKNDLRWCKNEWKLPSLNFTNIQLHSKCTKEHQPENYVPNGQDILKVTENDLVYNCFNRADVDPFKKITSNQSEDEVNKSWSEWVRTPCQFEYGRRCLGQKPNQCVKIEGGYILLINPLIKTLDTIQTTLSSSRRSTEFCTMVSCRLGQSFL